MQFFQHLFGSGGFQPHGFCYNWNSGLVWLHVLSDTFVALAYFAIPVILLVFVRKRRDIPFSWLFLLFGAFIVACGTTHLMEIWNLWHAQYWLAGVVKACTAVASVGTAIALARAVPALLRVPNLTEWAQANASLESLVAHRTKELRASNESLRYTNEMLRLAQLAGKTGAWERDLATGRSSWSPSLEALFGISAGTYSDLAPMWRELAHPDDVSLVDQAINASLLKPSEFAFEFRIIRPDKELRWIVARGSVVFDAAGRPERMLGICADITVQKNAEGKILALNVSLEARVAERTRDLTNANKELESFSYSVSHDLRSPLRTIDGFSLALLEDCGEKLDDVGKGHLQRIRAATQRMGQLIDDLLNLSRVTRAQLKSQTFDFSEVVSSVARDLQANQPDRAVSWDIQPGLSVTGDPRLIRLVVENLLGNAWKYTSRHPSASIHFGKTGHNGSSAFFVKDDGAGFDPAYADRLFGAFQRLHSPAEFPGTGVGLATVQRVIHRHGGEIWAESAVDKGATFFFTIPQSDSPPFKE
jgi:PAS domain S-box-containing protein